MGMSISVPIVVLVISLTVVALLILLVSVKYFSSNLEFYLSKCMRDNTRAFERSSKTLIDGLEFGLQSIFDANFSDEDSDDPIPVVISDTVSVSRKDKITKKPKMFWGHVDVSGDTKTGYFIDDSRSVEKPIDLHFVTNKDEKVSSGRTYLELINLRIHIPSVDKEDDVMTGSYWYNIEKADRAFRDMTVKISVKDKEVFAGRLGSPLDYFTRSFDITGLNLSYGQGFSTSIKFGDSHNLLAGTRVYVVVEAKIVTVGGSAKEFL